MISLCEAASFINTALGEDAPPVLDVRSPSEFACGHIPGAVNLPVFDDAARARIGKLYREHGQSPAFLEGLNLAGERLSWYVQEALRICPGKKVLMYCWRGGMRSESMARLLSLAGFEVILLKGGYKAFRRCLRERWESVSSLIVLAGKTGSGKTHLLQELRHYGQQFVDLECLARHKGSAFGGLGQKDQPANEQFENMLGMEFMRFDFNRPVWVEDESRAIGHVFIPAGLYARMQAALTICLEVPRQKRVSLLIEEYASHSPVLLKESLLRIQRRLGGLQVRQALAALDACDYALAAEIVLQYYDKMYDYDILQRDQARVFHMNLTDPLAGDAVKKLFDFAATIHAEQN